MTIIADKEKTPVAYLYNHTLVVPGSQEVLGVIIGDCVYGRKGDLKGKYINNTIYTYEGEMLAKGNGSTYDSSIDFTAVRQKSWQILKSIFIHSSPWITPKNTWARISFPDFLMS